MRPLLRFQRDAIGDFAGRYDYPSSETALVKLKAQVLRRGHLTKTELKRVAYWKAPRSARHAWKNSGDYVAEITSFSFRTKCERARIQSLTLLDGVGWPTASVILHLFHGDPYPILDFRALWSVSLEVPTQYTFGFWRHYVQFCRKLARSARVDMRTLDRALWQYSKENQPKRRSDEASTG